MKFPSPFASSAPHFARRKVCRRGFSLLELLAVMTLIGLLTAMVIPSMGSLGSAQGLTRATGDISDILKQARTYAMANNTYVYVGICEVDGAQSLGNRPQTAGTGRLFVSVAASKNGLSGIANGQWNALVTEINPVQRFDNVHLIEASQAQSRLPAMDAGYQGGNIDVATATALTPLSGLAHGMITTFSKVIQFSPAGSANLISDLSVAPAVPPYIQLGLAPSHGNQAANASGNCAGIQIDGVSGVVRAFRL